MTNSRQFLHKEELQYYPHSLILTHTELLAGRLQSWCNKYCLMTATDESIVV